MNLDKLNAVGQKITAQLIAIRESVGAPLGDYTAEKSDIELTSREVERLAADNPGEPIIINDEFHLAHIKDHLFSFKREHDAEVALHPNKCYRSGKKVHFYFCRTLTSMKRAGREYRYRLGSKISNIKLIDLADEENVGTRLLWCKNCITVLSDTARQYGIDKDRIAEYGDARQLMDCVKSLHHDDADALQKAHDFLHPNEGE